MKRIVLNKFQKEHLEFIMERYSRISIRELAQMTRLSIHTCRKFVEEFERRPEIDFTPEIETEYWVAGDILKDKNTPIIGPITDAAEAKKEFDKVLAQAKSMTKEYKYPVKDVLTPISGSKKSMKDNIEAIREAQKQNKTSSSITITVSSDEVKKLFWSLPLIHLKNEAK